MAKTKVKDIDITKSGPMTYRDLQQANQESYTNLSPEFKEFSMNIGANTAPISLYDARAHGEQMVLSSLGDSATPWGESMFDESNATEAQFQELGDIRANNLPWYALLAAGIGKGAVLAGTTFLDGTIGLLYGSISALANIGNDLETGWETFSRVWDNEISNGLQEVNKLSEKYMPNYYTLYELDAEWYKRLGTVNFWADGVLKNLGFMVGAMYSGSAWTKGLKLANILKETSTMGARISGSLLSAVNEGRIEANLNSADLKELEYKKLLDAYNRKYNEIISDNTIDKEEALNELDANFLNLLKLVDARVAKAGAIDLLENIPLLAFDDFMTYSRLYSRGFSNARDMAKLVAKEGTTQKKGWLSGLRLAGREGLKEEAKEASHVIEEGGKYIAKKATAKDTWKDVIKTGIREGNEELAQQMAANIAGNLYSTDGPDTYYEALKNPKSELKANELIASVTKAFAESYGDGDQWEQFAVGAISSLLGMPTFGRVNNSDANTVIGKNKPIGWSGGIIGEFKTASALNKEAEAKAATMNKTRERLQLHKGHYVQANSFTDSMDGFSEENDKFEYKNAEDNLDFSSIEAFANAGRLDDLKALVSQDFDNISDEELAKIAEFTSKNDKDGKPIGGWRNADGTLMSDTEDGRAKMRKELAAKKEDTLKKIDLYALAIQTVRAIGNNSLTDELNQELAWLLWKLNQFSDRFNSIKNENEETLIDFKNALLSWEDTLLNERQYLSQDTKRNNKGEMVADEEGENTKTLNQNTNMLTNVRATKELINQILSSKNPLLLASYLKSNPDFNKLLRSENFFDFVELMSNKSGLDYSTYSKTIQDLVDSERLAKAAEEFNNRYKLFISDPMSVINARLKKELKEEEKVQAQNEAKDNVNKKDKVNNAKVSDLVTQAEEGDVDLDDLDFTPEEDVNLDDDTSEEKDLSNPGKDKVKEAKKILDTKSKTLIELQKLLSRKEISQLQYDDAIALLDKSSSVSESHDIFTDLLSFAFNDGSILDMSNVDISLLSDLEIGDLLDLRILEAKNALLKAMNAAKESLDAAAKIPKGDTNTPEKDLGEVGHDAVARGESVNQKKKEEEEKKEELDNIDGSIKALKSMMYEAIAPLVPPTTLDTLISDINILASEFAKLRNLGVDVVSAINALQDTPPMQRIKYLAQNLAPIQESLIKWWGLKDETKLKPELGVASEEVIMTIPTADPINDATTQLILNLPNSGNNANFEGSYNFWKPTTTEVPIHWVKGDYTPYYEIAKGLKNADGSPKYTEAQLKRMEAVYKYLLKLNAWDNAFHVKEGDTINFVIDPSLEYEAGEPVILMQVNGQIVGDVMSINDSTSSRLAELTAFINRIILEYKLQGAPDFFISKETSKVAKKMVGKVPFTEINDRHTLNEIHTTKDSTGATKSVPFKLGVYVGNGRTLMTPGRRKELGASVEESTIISPLNAKAGTPFLLMSTGSAKRAYMPVPISMKRYTPSSPINARIYKAIDDVFNKLVTLKEGEEVKWIQELLELLSIPEMHLNFLENGNIKLTMVPIGEKKLITIYEGPLSPDIANAKLKLENTPFQISRKYINTTYKDGSDYNSMIGEIAETNVAVGKTHTISSWFTVNPINTQGQLEKAKSPKSIKENPASTGTQYTEYVHYYSGGSMLIKVDNKTYEVTKSDGTKVTGAKAMTYAARTYIINNKLAIPENGLVQTPWGIFNVTKGEFSATPASLLAAPLVSNKGKNGENLLAINESANALYDRLVKVLLKNVAKDELESIESNLKKLVQEFVKLKMQGATYNSAHDAIYDTALMQSIRNFIYDIGSFNHEIIEWWKLKIDGQQDNEESIKALLVVMEKALALKINSVALKSLSEDIYDLASEFVRLKNLGFTVTLAYNALKDSRPMKSIEIRMSNIEPFLQAITNWWRLEDNKLLAANNKEQWSIEESVKFLEDRIYKNLIIDNPQISIDALKPAIHNIAVEAVNLRKLGKDFNSIFLSIYLNPSMQKISPNVPSAYTSIEDAFFEWLGKLLEFELNSNTLVGTPTLEVVNPLDFTFTASGDVNLDDDIPSTNNTKSPAKEVTNEELDKQAKSKGLITLSSTQIMWDNLSIEDKLAILALPTIKAKSIINAANRNFDSKTKKFKGNFTIKDAINPTRNNTATQEDNDYDKWDEKQETEWLNKVLPQLSNDERLKIVKGLIKIANSPDSAKAWGQFKRGVIYISNKAAKGTLYHEAFHAVVHTLMSDNEVNTMFSEAAKKWGDIDEIALEENLAESFRRYVLLEETPVLGKVIKIFRTLKHIIYNIIGKETFIDNLFYKINRGKLSGRTLGDTTFNSYMSERGLESYLNELDYYKEDVKSINDEINKWNHITGEFTLMKKDYDNGLITLRYFGKETIFGNTSFEYESEANAAINQSKYRDLLYTLYNRGRYYIYAKRLTLLREEKSKKLISLRKSLSQALKKVDEMQSFIDNNKWMLASRDLMNSSEGYYRRVDQYYRDTMDYGNLDAETKLYLSDRGVTIEEYQLMTLNEKEVLLHCKM